MRFYSCFLLAVVLLVAPVVSSQPHGPQLGVPPVRQRQSDDEVRREHERVKAMNKQRAERIKRDTDKLLDLATQLKQYVDKTNENVLSIEVIKKAEEVEKLAKSIREKMKEDYRGADQVIRP